MKMGEKGMTGVEERCRPNFCVFVSSTNDILRVDYLRVKP